MAVPLETPHTIISFNARVSRGDEAMIRSVKGILHDHAGTDVLLFQECAEYVDALRRTFSDDWIIYARDGWPESLHNPVMVRKDPGFPRRSYGAGWGTVRNKTRWIGPIHGLDHAGRTWTWVKVGTVYVMSLHRATDGDGQNRRAYLEEAGRLKEFMRRGQRPRHIIIFGDTNTAYRAKHPGSMENIRADVKGRLLVDTRDPGIDYALVTRNVAAKVNRTENYGSDHLAAVMRGVRLS
jgi:hypothetical protein